MNKKTKIALGTWSWSVGMYGGDQVFGNHISEEDLKIVFDEAMKNGLTLWDTATAYGFDDSERILGRFIQKYPRESVISTKFTPQLVGERNPQTAVNELFNENLKNLQTDYIDLYWIHNPHDVALWTPQLIDLLQSGKVKSVGVSNHNLAQIKQANEILASAGFKISAVQNHFSLLYRSSEKAGILQYCKENNIDFYAYMTLEQGVLSGRYNSQNPLPNGSNRAKTYNEILSKLDILTAKMSEIGQKYKASVAQIAMAYAICKGTIPIVGVTKPHHIADALGAINIGLSETEITELEQLAQQTGVDTKGGWENPMH